MARVLIVDDDPQVLEIISLMLDPSLYLVLHAHSGEECLRIAGSESPDVILLDVHMTGMDGNETATSLSRNEKTRNIPIVMMTGLIEDADRIKALKAGAVDFLMKPLVREELAAKIASIVRLKAYHNDTLDQREALVAEVAGKTGQLTAALETFSRFVPSEFLTCLSKKNIIDIALGDQVQTNLSILFADIRSFTAMSERMTAQENFKFLNSYFSRMNPYIWENGGYIDKYMGDAIMALFPTGPDAALDAAILMLKHIPVYNNQRSRFGYEPIKIGIGVNDGNVMLGIIGSERFMQGTVISDAVNLASRLEGLTKEYGVTLIISRYVLFGLKDADRYHYRFLDNVRLKGKTEAVPVYEMFDADPPALIEQKIATRDVFEKAIYEFHAGRYNSAIDLFQSLLPLSIADKPVEIYKTRCLHAIAEGRHKRDSPEYCMLEPVEEI
ncbi:MAG: response regulator [Treponemataceae bacterium]